MSAFTSSTTDTDATTGLADPQGEAAFDHALASPADATRLLLFTAAGRTCACEIGAVREIIPCRRATRLPGAPEFVTGLINLRGSIVTVLDLSLRLGGRPADAETGSIILVEAGGRTVGLGVDELRDVLRIPRASIEAAGDMGDGDGLVCGVLRAGDDVAVLLDVGHVIRHALL